jgi:glc operon protein GlcG
VEKKELTLEGAKQVIEAAANDSKKHGIAVTIAVVDAGGHLIAAQRLDGAGPAGATISIGKARTAAVFRRPTRVLEEMINKGRTAFAALADFTPLQDGVPIEVDGQVIGAIGVSGAAPQQDEDIAMAGLSVVKGFAGKPAGSQ